MGRQFTIGALMAVIAVAGLLSGVSAFVAGLDGPLRNRLVVGVGVLVASLLFLSAIVGLLRDWLCNWPD